MSRKFNIQTLIFEAFHKREVYRKIALLLVSGNSKGKVAKLLDSNPVSIHYYAKRLEETKVIRRKVRTSSVIYDKGENYARFFSETAEIKVQEEGVLGFFFKDKLRIHDQRFLIPIVEEKPCPAGFWQRISKDGKRKYRYFLSTTLGEVTIENSGGNIKLYIKEKEIPLNKHFRETSRGATDQTLREVTDLLQKGGVALKMSELKELHLHSASEMVKQIGSTNVSAELDLQRPSEGDFGQIDTNAKAWVDRSKGTPELESNDFSYWEKFLDMPEVISALPPLLRFIVTGQAEFTKNLKQHQKAIEEIGSSQRELAAALRAFTDKIDRMKDTKPNILNKEGVE